MVDVAAALDSHELIILRIIGEWLEQDLTGMNHRQCVKTLAPLLAVLDMQHELSYLPAEESAAFRALVAAGGRIPAGAYERQFGNVRQMGPGKLEREEPWLDPISPAEALWYRGFLFRGFLEAEEGQLVEYYYLPAEYLAHFPKSRDSQAAGPGRQLQPAESTKISSSELTEAPVDCVDDVTGLLAHAQLYPLQEGELDRIAIWMVDRNPKRLSMLYHICWDLKFFRAADEGARPARTAVRWLKLDREEQIRELTDGWFSCAWNELQHVPGLLVEDSNWPNEPQLARSAVKDALPDNSSWYELGALINLIKEENPDFQRPDGRYDTWYIRERKSGGFLSGFENWDLVEGQLIRFLIEGPLHWLGLVDLYQGEEESGLLFRLTERALEWLQERPASKNEVSIPIVVNNDATIVVPKNADRYHRFQVARICRFLPPSKDKPFVYWLTPSTMALASEQGIEPARVIEFLESASQRELPPGTRRAIERWSDKGVEARLEKAIILRVREAQILEKLRANPKTRPYIGETLGDLAATVQPKDWQKLRKAAAQIGLLLDETIGEDQG